MKKSVLLLVLFMFMTACSFSQQGNMENKKNIKGRNPIAKLELTQDQKDKMSSLRSEHQKVMIDLKANLEKLHVDLRDIQKSDNINKSDYLNKVDQISAAKSKIAKTQAEFKFDLYSLLTDAQKKQVKNMPFMGGMRPGMGNRMMKKGGHKMGMGMRDGSGMNCPMNDSKENGLSMLDDNDMDDFAMLEDAPDMPDFPMINDAPEQIPVAPQE